MKRHFILILLLALFTTSLQAQIVGVNEKPSASINTSSSLYKPTGHFMKFEAGFVWASVTYDYQINPYIMVGGGIGLGWGMTIPVYTEAIFSTPRNKWSVYANVKFGYSIISDHHEGPFSAILLGVNYKNFGLGAGYIISFSDEGFLPCVLSYKLPLNKLL